LKVFDRDKSMRVSWEDWVGALAKLVARAPAGAPGLPKTQEQVAATWRALDQDCSGWIALREFDTESFDILAAVKRWIDRAHGGMISRALHSAAEARNGAPIEIKACTMAQASKGALKSSLRREAALNKDELHALFEGLDIKDGTIISETDLKFLERWDLAFEDQLLVVEAAHAAEREKTWG